MVRSSSRGGRVGTRAVAIGAAALLAGANVSAQNAPGGGGGAAAPARFQTDRPIATQNVEVTTGATPSGNDAPTAQTRTADATVDAPTGPIGPADAARIVNAQMPRMRPCYERALTSHAGLQGRLELRFTIGADGRVTQARVYGMNEAPEVATCIQQVLQATTFPRPQGGSLPLIQPVTFAPPLNARAARGRGRVAPTRTAATATRGSARAN